MLKISQETNRGSCVTAGRPEKKKHGGQMLNLRKICSSFISKEISFQEVKDTLKLVSK